MKPRNGRGNQKTSVNFQGRSSKCSQGPKKNPTHRYLAIGFFDFESVVHN